MGTFLISVTPGGYREGIGSEMRNVPTSHLFLARASNTLCSFLMTSSGVIRSITPGRSILVVHGRSTADLPSRRRAARSYLSTHHWRLRYGPERAGLVAAYSPTTGMPTAVP